MPSENVLSVNHEPEPGLPPVTPPSATFIAQLFLIPLGIVTVVFLVAGFFVWMWADSRTDSTQVLKQLQSSNPDVRWRAASEFAQKLKRDPNLASSPKVALQLTALLRQALNDLAQAEQNAAVTDTNQRRKTLKEKRSDVQFLSPCLGSLIIPTGAPLLAEIATQAPGGDPKTVALLRRQAVWALANLGENLKQFQKLSPERVEAVLAELEQELPTLQGEQATWARLTRDYLRGETKKVGAIPALVACAQADEPSLRELAAYALTFWDGDAAENALAEKTLLTLTHDDGHGVRLDLGESD